MGTFLSGSSKLAFLPPPLPCLLLSSSIFVFCFLTADFRFLLFPLFSVSVFRYIWLLGYRRTFSRVPRFVSFTKEGRTCLGWAGLGWVGCLGRFFSFFFLFFLFFFFFFFFVLFSRYFPSQLRKKRVIWRKDFSIFETFYSSCFHLSILPPLRMGLYEFKSNQEIGRAHV